VGLINSVLVVRLKITPFIATLGTMYMGRGLSYLVSGGLVIREGLPDAFSYVGNESLGPVPYTIVALVGVVAVFLVLERRSVLGKYSVAIGGNRTAAMLSGIDTDRIVSTLYILAGAFAGFAGVLMASRLGVGDPNIGIGFEFDVIVAVISGHQPGGGEGSILGMIIGALIIGGLGNGLKLLNVFTFFQSIMKGFVLVLAVLLDQNLKLRPRSRRPGRRRGPGAGMTHRQRVLAALDHREPDRVPIDVWGSASRICNELYFQIVKDQGWEGLGPCVRASRSGTTWTSGWTACWTRISGTWTSGTRATSPAA